MTFFIIFFVGLLLLTLSIGLNRPLSPPWLIIHLLAAIILFTEPNAYNVADRGGYYDILHGYINADIDYQFSFIIFRSEIAWLFIVRSIYVFVDDPALLYGLVSVINLCLMYFSCWFILDQFINKSFLANQSDKDESVNHLLLLLIIYSWFASYYCLSVLRAGLSIAFMMLSFGLLMRKYWILSSFAVMMSALSHATGFLSWFSMGALPLMKFSKKWYLTFWLFWFLVALTPIPALFANIDFNSLLGLSTVKSISVLGAYASINFGNTAEVFPFFLFYKLIVVFFVIITLPKSPLLCFNLLNVVLIGTALSVLGRDVSAFSRLSDFFFIPIIPLLYVCIEETKRFMGKFWLCFFFSMPVFVFNLRLVLRDY